MVQMCTSYHAFYLFILTRGISSNRVQLPQRVVLAFLNCPFFRLALQDNRIHIGAVLEMRVVTLGLDGAGKTSILFQLQQNACPNTIPTIGFNVETLHYKNFKVIKLSLE